MKRVLLFFATLWLGIMGASAQEYHYDVNNDGDVNINDVVALVNKILGKDNPGEEAGREVIDLGLPSGTKWASCNVGATKPEEYGGYYAWGETEEKNGYSQDTYRYYKKGEYVNLGSDISGTEYDVAHVKWGGNWCMPSWDDLIELEHNCTNEWTTLNGVYGRKFTSNINGNSIFLPAAGYRCYGDHYYRGGYGDYWSSTQVPSDLRNACHLFFSSGYARLYDISSREYGRSVRPVVRN